MVSIVIPALNESTRIGSVVQFARNSPLVSEVVVVDDGSVDGTPKEARNAGARVITSSLLGKGASMEDGLRATSGSVIVYLDGDLDGLNPALIESLVAPILADRADLVKAKFSREAGRVTVLTAKPLLRVFFPELAHFAQPLGGIAAIRRSTAERLRIETDYGADLGLLIDAVMLGFRVEEADIGYLAHESQTLDALGQMAMQVVRTLIDRARRFGRLNGSHVEEVEEVERHANDELAIQLETDGEIQGLALFDMDGTLIQGRTVSEVAALAGKTGQLVEFLDNPRLRDEVRAQSIAEALRGVPKRLFETVAREIPLTAGAVETIRALRRNGFRVGIVSDSYRVATEIVRRRVFADFSVANLLRFSGGTATGGLTLSAMFTHSAGCPDHGSCKSNVLRHLRERLGVPANDVLAVGDNTNDACMLRLAGTSFAFEPKGSVVAACGQVIRRDLRALLTPTLRRRAAA